jgi:diguanylate cyclase (GGDEF)-like protein
MNRLSKAQLKIPETAPQFTVDFWFHDPFLKELYHKALQTYPIDWRWETSPNNWRQLLQKQKPEYLILDLSLVADNPIQALQEMKSISPRTEIIVLSHTEDVHVAISAFKSGISDYYLKPTNPETLWYALQKLFSQKSLHTDDPTLQIDLEIFSVTHHINIAESDLKMRELAVQHLIGLLKASGGIWLCPSMHLPAMTEAQNQILDGTSFHFQPWGFDSTDQALNKLTAFQKRYPLLIRDSFFTHLTSHPENWFRENCVWIPLKNSYMGGILLFDTKEKPNSHIETRTEFLIRSLEVSIENHRRFIEAKQLTYIDDLTGLFNPRYLDHAIGIAMDHLDKKEQGFCVLFIDVDRFKQVNDQHGHIIGSQMLGHIGRLLKTGLRKNDQVFRYGGDEYIAVLYGTELATAQEIAERIRKTAEARIFKFPGVSIKITLSIGIARFPEHGKDKQSIISMADTAMYTSKKQGRNQVIVAEPETHV